MHQIRVTENRVTVGREDLHECYLQFLNNLKEGFENIDSQIAISERSKSLKSEIEKSYTDKSMVRWEKVSVLTGRQTVEVPATLQLDGIGKCAGKCGTVHLLNIVLCLNNREGIGTNFMKLEVAAKENIRNYHSNTIFDENVLGVMVTLDDSLLSAGSWDSAYANANEYTFNFQKAYKGLLKSNIIGMQLNYI